MKDSSAVANFTKKGHGINAYEIERLDDTAEKCLAIVNFCLGRLGLTKAGITRVIMIDGRLNLFEVHRYIFSRVSEPLFGGRIDDEEVY